MELHLLNMSRKNKNSDRPLKELCTNQNIDFSCSSPTKKDEGDHDIHDYEDHLLSQLKKHLKVLQNEGSNMENTLLAMRSFRQLLTNNDINNPSIQQHLDDGVLRFLTTFLHHEIAEIQFETTLLLTNIAATEYTVKVVQSGALPPLIQSLSSPDPDVRRQSAWCLGNIAGDGHALRDFALRTGAFGAL